MSPLLQVLAPRLAFFFLITCSSLARSSIGYLHIRVRCYFILYCSGSSSPVLRLFALVRFPKLETPSVPSVSVPALRLGTLRPRIRHSISQNMSLFPSRLRALSIRNKRITLPCHPSRNSLARLWHAAPFLAQLFLLSPLCLRCAKMK